MKPDDYDKKEHPEWVGLRHKVKKEVQESQQEEGCGVFI